MKRMKATNKISNKRVYLQPVINKIIIDNEITLQLDSNLSNPGDDPLFSNNNSFNNQPFKANGV
jgi:hypothetical protein